MASRGNYSSSIYAGLSLNGDGSTFDMSVDGSGTPQRFWYQAPSDRLAYVERIIVSIRDNQALAAETYGNITELSTGIVLRITKDSTVLLNITPITIKTNAGWAAYCYDAKTLDFGNGDNYIVIRWTFGKSGQPVILDGSNDEKLELVVQDDLGTLIDHVAVVEGYTRGLGTSDFRPKLYSFIQNLLPFGV